MDAPARESVDVRAVVLACLIEIVWYILVAGSPKAVRCGSSGCVLGVDRFVAANQPANRPITGNNLIR